MLEIDNPDQTWVWVWFEGDREFRANWDEKPGARRGQVLVYERETDRFRLVMSLAMRNDKTVEAARVRVENYRRERA